MKLNAVILVAQLLPGKDLAEGIAEAIALAKEHNDEVTFQCNDIKLFLTPNSDSKDEYKKFQDKKPK